MPVGDAEVGVVSGESQLKSTVGRSSRFDSKCVDSISKDQKPADPAPPSSGEAVAVQTAILPVSIATGSLPGRTSWTPSSKSKPRRRRHEDRPAIGPGRACRWSRFLSMLTEPDVDSKENPLDIADFLEIGMRITQSSSSTSTQSSATVPAKPGSSSLTIDLRRRGRSARPRPRRRRGRRHEDRDARHGSTIQYSADPEGQVILPLRPIVAILAALRETTSTTRAGRRPPVDRPWPSRKTMARSGLRPESISGIRSRNSPSAADPDGSTPG